MRTFNTGWGVWAGLGAAVHSQCQGRVEGPQGPDPNPGRGVGGRSSVRATRRPGPEEREPRITPSTAPNPPRFPTPTLRPQSCRERAPSLPRAHSRPGVQGRTAGSSRTPSAASSLTYPGCGRPRARAQEGPASGWEGPVRSEQRHACDSQGPSSLRAQWLNFTHDADSLLRMTFQRADKWRRLNVAAGRDRQEATVQKLQTTERPSSQVRVLRREIQIPRRGQARPPVAHQGGGHAERPDQLPDGHDDRSPHTHGPQRLSTEQVEQPRVFSVRR